MDRLQLHIKAMELFSQGKTAVEISKDINVPRETIIYWIKNKVKVRGTPNRTSRVDDESFSSAVRESFSIAQALAKVGLEPQGANYKSFHKRVERLGLDVSHFSGQGHLRGKTHSWAPEIPLDESFIEDGNLGTSSLKKKILKYNLKEYSCAFCSINSWLDKPLSLHLDHINGINNDNRLENLRFLCPNCHSQTETYCGKSIGKREPRPEFESGNIPS